VIEARFAPNPIVPLRTFRRRSLTVANAQSTAVGAVVFGCYFFLSLYFQDVLGYSPLLTGMAFLPMGVMTFSGALVASRLVNRVGIRRQLIVAPLLTTAAVLWLSGLSPESDYFTSLFLPLLLLGVSVGVTFVPMAMAATMGVPQSESGLASGLLNTSRQLGGALGLAILTTFAATQIRTALVGGEAHVTALSHGYTRGFIAIGVISALGALCAVFLGANSSHQTPAREATEANRIVEVG
jgi:predicted MFS family arabinose efflux permease